MLDAIRKQTQVTRRPDLEVSSLLTTGGHQSPPPFSKALLQRDHLFPLPSVHGGDRALQEILSDHTVAIPDSSGLWPVVQSMEMLFPCTLALGHDKQIKTKCWEQQLQGSREVLADCSKAQMGGMRACTVLQIWKDPHLCFLLPTSWDSNRKTAN